MTNRIPARLAEHPTVRAVRARAAADVPDVIDADWLRQLCLDAGADDVAFASVDDPALASEREHAEAALPGVRSYISLVVKMNRDNVRSTARSVANQEFHRTGEIINEAAHRITRALEDAGQRALNPSATFPMEMDRFPGRIWVVAHKPVAVAAGLGVMGIHRNVIHPRFGNFILLATILVGAPVSSYGAPLDYSPCLECKLCVAACPVGAIGKDGEFDFLACSVHNYREFMGGFTDWA
ncbi:epoxyqueuosine reductase, partial [Mycolicibacterium sp.]